MFIIAAEVYVFGAIVYIILGKGERQWWAGGERKDRLDMVKDEKRIIYDDPEMARTKRSSTGSTINNTLRHIQHPTFN